MSLQGKKLKTRTSSKTNETKEETAEKVKALREKQNQWMKEREASKTSSKKLKTINKDNVTLPDVPKSRTRTGMSGSPAEVVNAANRNPYSNPRRKPLYQEPQRDHSDLISWISKADNPLVNKQRPPSATSSHKRNPTSSRSSTRENSDNDMKTNKEYVPSNYEKPSSTRLLSNTVLSSSKQTLHNKLRPSSRTSVKSNSSYHGDDGSHGNTNDDFLLDNPVNNPQSEVTFANEDAKSKTPELSADILNALADSVAERLKATLHPPASSKQGKQNANEHNESAIASHLCPLCEKHMTGRRHTPMAAIPCGHTYCQTCISDCKKCPTCQTVVRSTAVNTVLQGIIKDFNEQKERERLQKMEEQTRQYVDEYQSLVVRCNALNDEAESILNNMEEVTEQLLDEKKMIKKLEMDKEELKEKINKLQTELDSVAVKEQECHSQCHNLETRYNEEKERLSLIEDTVQRIGKSKERVKIMIHNFAPSLNLDDYE